MKINKLISLCVVFTIFLTTTAYAAPSSFELLNEAELSILQQETEETAIPSGNHNDLDGIRRWKLDYGSNPTGASARYSNGRLSLIQNSATNNKVGKAFYYPNIIVDKSNLAVEFTYQPNFGDIGPLTNKWQFIHLAAADTGTAKVFTSPVAMPSYDVLKNEIGLIIHNTKLYYVTGLNTQPIEVSGFSIESGTTYYIRMDVRPAEQVYDLYVSTQKIGINTPKLLSEISLANVLDQVVPTILHFGVRKDATVEAPQSMNISDIKYYQYGEIYGGGAIGEPRVFVNETFDQYNAGNDPSSIDIESGILGSSWIVKNARMEGANTRVMTRFGTLYEATGTTSGTGNKMLRLGDMSLSSGNYNNSSYAYYKNDDLGDQETVTTSFEFITKAKNESSIYIQSLALGSEEIPVKSLTDYTLFTEVPINYNSASIHMVRYESKGLNGIYYGDEENKTLTAIPGIAFQTDTKYYAKFVVDNTTHTFDLYLSTNPITDETLPVLENKAMFAPTDTVKNPTRFWLNHNEITANTDNNDIWIDNLLIAGDLVEGTDPDPDPDPDTSLKTYDDNGDIIEDLSQSTSYIDLLGDGEDTFIMASYKNGMIVNVSVSTAVLGTAKNRLAIDYENIDFVKIINLEDLSGLKPIGNVIKLEKE